MRELQKINPEFPLQYAVCLAHISMDEGMSLTALADRTGLALSTVSRIVGSLSSQKQKGTSYNLVKVHVSPNERRRKELYLTVRGKAVISSLENIIDPSRRKTA
jgi:DNA-binding MarR family transcriptional regulator